MLFSLRVVTSSRRTARPFAWLNARAVSASSSSRARCTVIRSLAAICAWSNRPLLLDEAHRLPPAAMGRLRSVHNQAGVSVIMFGTHEILDRIDDRANGRGQMSGRCLRYNAWSTF
ncbi:MAG: ATP-binding protein [Phycisphaeraceae bacterium]